MRTFPTAPEGIVGSVLSDTNSTRGTTRSLSTKIRSRVPRSIPTSAFGGLVNKLEAVVGKCACFVFVDPPFPPSFYFSTTEVDAGRGPSRAETEAGMLTTLSPRSPGLLLH